MGQEAERRRTSALEAAREAQRYSEECTAGVNRVNQQIAELDLSQKARELRLLTIRRDMLMKTDAVERRIEDFLSLSFRGRLKWLFTGKVALSGPREHLHVSPARGRSARAV